MKKIGYLHSGSFYQLTCLKDPLVQAFDVVPLYLPKLTEEEILACDSLLLTNYMHKRFFRKFLPTFQHFLDDPHHKMVVEGENDTQALLGVKTEERVVNFWGWRIGDNQGRENKNPQSLMWNYFTEPSFHWHFHGAMELPENAVSLVDVPEHNHDGCTSIVYYDDQSFAAPIVVSQMDASFHHGMGFMPGATTHLLQSLHWLSV
ncbi:MAG: hypothetical protein J6M18_05470 [Actinomycetaceae bacterium]|nr:hypothetical protein [Actinomycetaceae bacterium]